MSNFWNRCCSRLLDWGLFYFLIVLLSLMLPSEVEEGFYLYLAVVTPLLWSPVEALLLSTCGVTPSQALFGTQVRDISGEKLSFRQALKRALFWPPRSGIANYHKINPLRYIIALVTALACGSTLFLGQNLSDVAVNYEKQMVGKWIQYASDEGRFTVKFPKEPQEESHSFPVPHSEEPLELSEYKSKGDVVFSVSYVELPAKWRIFGAGTLLKAAMQVVQSYTSGTELLEKHRVKHKSYPAMDFRMKEGDKEVEGRLILVGSTLYKLTITAPSEELSQAQNEAFLSSFESTG